MNIKIKANETCGIAGNPLFILVDERGNRIENANFIGFAGEQNIGGNEYTYITICMPSNRLWFSAEDRELAEVPVSRLCLPTREANFMVRYHIHTVNDLADAINRDILQSIPGIGPKSQAVIVSKIIEYGYGRMLHSNMR